MTPQEAIDFIENEVQIDVRYCSVEKVDKTKEVFELAKSALEKQIPQKPAVFNGYSQGRYTVAFCPNCKKLLGLLNMARTDECCVKCGQALDWSETE